ncbi:restriction endonuclease subunit S [Blautia wexlerae]|uniref:restriction endonuclease subunit S n=1 Tax=Blautia wexlerae TaxID=418240 RepID=UPI0009DBA02C|nr:restriction endonuclease subunit S [Blautia wexlerae]
MEGKKFVGICSDDGSRAVVNANPWEQRKLGDSCKLNGRIGFRGYTEKDIISKEAGGVLTFSPTNIVDNKLTIECKNTYITREKYDESPEIKISNGDILFVKTGSTLGKSALVTGLKEDASINPQIVVMRVEKDTENFMSNVLITDRVMKQVAAVKIGGAVPTMTETELKNFTYFAPAEKEEKKKIGDYFRTLDHLITLHQRKPIPNPNHPIIHTKHKGEEKYVRIRVNDREKTNRTANLRRFPVDIPGGFKDGGRSVGEFQIYSGAE